MEIVMLLMVYLFGWKCAEHAVQKCFILFVFRLHL